MSYQVIKLSNGEDIVCRVHKNTSTAESNKLKISSPLLMETVTRDTEKGAVESLALSRWVQPYSDENHFNIEKHSIVIMAPASHGLSKYYEYVLSGMNKIIIDKPTKKELDKIEKEDIDSEVLENMLDSIFKKTTYH